MSSQRHLNPRPPQERVRDFGEIMGLIRPQWAVAEARRCLGCEDAPCIAGCPARVDIPRFIRAIRSQNFRGAIKTIRQANVLPGICARVCPQGSLCEGRCSSTDLSEPIAIGALQRFAADEERRGPLRPEKVPEATRGPVAVVGSGPAGLAAAAGLARRGIKTTVFEARERPGGLLSHGIPAYRLPPEVVDHELRWIVALGLSLRTASPVASLTDLRDQGYKAVILAPGLPGVPSLAAPGADLQGVLSWSDVLEGRAQAPLGPRAVVVGGGNSAIDAARTALRRGAREVMVLYRRSEAEMPAYGPEVAEAQEEGISFRFLAAPLEILGQEGRVRQMVVQAMTLGEPDASGRQRPVPLEGVTETLDVDLVIAALGQVADPGPARCMPELLSPSGRVLTDDSGRTAVDWVFACGDAVTGGSTVVHAVAGGERVAATVVESLS